MCYKLATAAATVIVVAATATAAADENEHEDDYPSAAVSAKRTIGITHLTDLPSVFNNILCYRIFFVTKAIKRG